MAVVIITAALLLRRLVVAAVIPAAITINSISIAISAAIVPNTAVAYVAKVSFLCPYYRFRHRSKLTNV